MEEIDVSEKKMVFVIVKEFYRIALLGMSVFFAYYLIANSDIFSLPEYSKEISLKIIYVAAALLTATIFIKSLEVFFWEKLKTEKKIVSVPTLLKQGINVIIYTATLFFVLKTVFDISITGLLTATGAMGVVIGLSLKEIITDVFSGLVIAFDRSVKMGDYVRVEGRTFTEKVGCITEMNWRTVHVTTPENVLVIVPNTFITNNVITNLSLPSEQKEFEIIFTFDFDVSSERILRVLNAALYQTGEILQDPEPKTRISRVTGTGVEYKVKYWIVPSKIGPGKARNFVINNVLYNLAQAGVSLAYPKSDVFHSELPVRNMDIKEDRVGLLRKIELFSVLSNQEITELAAGLSPRPVKKNEFIVKSGETGSSMYILVEGLLNVYILDSRNNTEIKVAQLKPGSYFGEMSLLTGEPRSASIMAFCDSYLFEIPKENIDRLLRGEPEIAISMSKKIADIKLKNDHAFQNQDHHEKENTKSELSSSILSKIKDFFKLF